MIPGYFLTLVLHRLWSSYQLLKEAFIHHIWHRVWHGCPAEVAPIAHGGLVTCHYRWVDGCVYTLVQPHPAVLSGTLYCALVLLQAGDEIDVTADLRRLLGPHMDFHGAELTVHDVLECLGISPDSFAGLVVSWNQGTEHRDDEYGHLHTSIKLF